MPEFEFLLDLRQTSTVIEPPQRRQSTTEILIRHLITRLCQNELVSIDGDISRALQTAWAAAVPQVFAVLLLFPIYHQPGTPRTYWPQAGDHFFFVIYAFFIMGAVALYSWDLLFPDAIDVFVLGSLPIPSRNLLAARVIAIAAFLLATLLGTSSLGALFMPLVADQPHLQWHLLAHITAIATAAAFAAGSVLAVQGLILTLMSERTFHRLTPALQTLGMLLLFATLFATPQIIGNLQHITSQHWVVYVPPLWFLGIYERIMHGPSTPAIFNTLALRGIAGTCIVCIITCITYPIAYKRKVKLVMEGTIQVTRNRKLFAKLSGHVAALLCNKPTQRGVFQFIMQTLWRSRRPRTMMAIFLSIGIALAIVRLLPPDLHAVQLALVTITFFTFFGLRAAFASPVDIRGTWLFRAVLGRETTEILNVQQRFTIATVLTISAVLILVFASMHLLPLTAVVPTLLVLAAFALIASDLYNRKTTAIPFTEARKSTHSERPLAAVRYLLVFPVLLTWMPIWMAMRWRRLLVFTAITWAAHTLLVRSTERLRANDFKGNIDQSDPEAYPTSLGLRE